LLTFEGLSVDAECMVVTPLPDPRSAPAAGGLDQEMRRKGPRLCTVSGCERGHSGKDLCDMHLKRMHAHGTTETPDLRPKPCTTPGCIHYARARGLCHLHYARAVREEKRQLCTTETK
jgi:hypothetical protein